MAFFKFTNTVDGDDDAIFVEAESEAAARGVFSAQIGPMPPSMLKVELVATLPDGEEAITA